MDYSSAGLFSGVCYGPGGEKRDIASLLSGADLDAYKEWRSLVKKNSSWIKESKSIAKGKTRRIVEEEDEIEIQCHRVRMSVNREEMILRNIKAYASSGSETRSISIGFTRKEDGISFSIDVDADDVMAAIKEYA